jgi:hypothetical protein
LLALSLKRLALDVAVEIVQAFLKFEAEDAEDSTNIDLMRICESDSRFVRPGAASPSDAW